MDDSKLRGGKILRSADPLNLEMPFERLESFIRRVGLFMPRILTPGWDSTNQQIMCDRMAGIYEPQQTNKLGL